MREERGKIKIFLILFGLPFTFLATLIVVYVGLYGWTSPFEIKMKTELKPGQVVTDQEIVRYKMTLVDSVQALEKQIARLIDSTRVIQQQAQAWMDSLAALRAHKKKLEKDIARVRADLASLKQQVDAEKLQRMNRLTKIFKSLTPEQLDSLYVASLDDQTLMDIISMAKAQQAAAVLSKVDPRRAARLTARYVNPRKNGY